MSQNVFTSLPERFVEFTESTIPLDSSDAVSKEDDSNDVAEAIAELRFCEGKYFKF